MTDLNKDTLRLGIVGIGNMGGAILDGLRRAAWIDDARIRVYDPGKSAPEGIASAPSLVVLAEDVDVLLLGVKPHLITPVLQELSASDARPAVIISVAAGVSLAALDIAFPHMNTALYRVMPNTAAAVGAATSAIVGQGTAETDMIVKSMFDAVGTTVVLDSESLMHAFIGIAGSGPAFAYVFAEALADGAVAEGMPRAQAQLLAASMLNGVSALLMAEGGSPAVRKDAVASPGGTTIEGLVALEDRGFRSATIAAVRSAAGKSRSMQG